MADFTTRPTLQGTFGMASSTHWLASQAAMRMLELGGNAFDAAVAGGFVLHVVEPHLNGPGGDLPAIVATADDPTPRVLCGQGPAPRAATREAYAALGLDHVPGSGVAAAAVPGAVDAWLLLLRDHGTLPLATVLEPALGYAEHGHPVLPRVVDTLARVQALFERDWPTSAELWLPGGHVPRPGELVRNAPYAAVLRRLGEAATSAGSDVAGQAEAARRAWGEGFVAEAVDAFRARSWRHRHGEAELEVTGFVDGQDLADFSATWEPAVVRSFAGAEVAKTDLWGQGPGLLQVLGVLEHRGLTDPDTPEGAHALVEAWKLAMADREAWFGDRSPVSVDDLLDPAYLTERAALVGETADHGLRPGSPGGLEPRLAEHVRRLVAGEAVAVGDGVTTGEPTVQRAASELEGRGDTCHLDVVDRWGNVVSATPSGGWLQSSPVIPELGFCLGSRSQMFWLDEGLPASLEPGARPRTTLTPTLVLRDGVPVVACGSPGGDQQDQWQSLFLLRHLVGGMTLQEAIDAPMSHTTSFPGSFHPRGMEPGAVVAESRTSPEVLDGLRARGHAVTVDGPWTLGRMCAVSRDPATGLLQAGANPRGMQGYAVGR
ncbi:gamma-glutamyltransferase family protein [Nocardioides marmoraquaticus]